MAVFDFAFVPPRNTFEVDDAQYVVTFGVMLAVGLLIGTLTSRLRGQVVQARQREQRAAALFQLSRDLSAGREPRDLLAAALRRIAEVFEVRGVILLPGPEGRLEVAAGELPQSEGGHERGVAQWTFDQGQIAGAGTPTLPASRGLYLPLKGTAGLLGVLGVGPDVPRNLFAPDRYRLLLTFTNQIAVALERAQLARHAERVRVDVETERMRNALLSSVSHDLRTPLTVITGAATSLRDDATLPAPARREMLDTIADEAGRLGRLVGDLLEITRLESGAVQVHKEWHSLEELLGAVLRRLDPVLAGREVAVRLPGSLPLVPLDDVLFDQALANLLENAVKYSPAAAPIGIEARLDGDHLVVEIADRGPGLAPGEEARVFEKFYRGGRAGPRRGAGLGLTIARAIVEAHEGRISAQPRSGGGALFRIELPLGGDPPEVEAEAAGDEPGGGEGRMSEDAPVAGPPVVVLVIEDDEPIRRFLRAALASQGFALVESATGADGIAQAAMRQPDLIVLDLGLPDVDGIEVTRRVREWSTVPILVLSARGQEGDKIRALDAGADDYVTKPFSMGELLARMRVALRHGARARAGTDDSVVEAGPLRIDHARRQVTLEGAEVRLTPIEYRLLAALARFPGRVLTHEHLLREVWGPSHTSQHHYLRVYMAQLRHKLERDPSRPALLLTEPGVGYRLAEG